MLWTITRRLTTDTGSIDKAAVRWRINYERTTHRLSLSDAVTRTHRAINDEIERVAHLSALNAAFEAQRQIEREDAEDLARRYGFDEYRLMEQRNRWQGKIGSRFGAQQEYERFCRALKLARARQAETREVA